MAAELTLEEVIEFLLDAPMFGDLPERELSQIVHILQIRRLEADAWVFREGEAGDAWYVVFEGEVEVVRQIDDAPRVIAVLGERCCFGEMAILDGGPRSASVRAAGPLTLFRFPRSRFDALLEDGNLAAYRLVHQMARVLVERQRDTTSRLVQLLSEVDEEIRGSLAPIVTKHQAAE